MIVRYLGQVLRFEYLKKFGYIFPNGIPVQTRSILSECFLVSINRLSGCCRMLDGAGKLTARTLCKMGTVSSDQN
jgi:hypothetical protein